MPVRHEGFGSPFALLKARGWATELSAGEGGSSFSARSFFTVGINLTDEGKRRTTNQHVSQLAQSLHQKVTLHACMHAGRLALSEPHVRLLPRNGRFE